MFVFSFIITYQTNAIFVKLSILRVIFMLNNTIIDICYSFNYNGIYINILPNEQ